MNQSELKSDLIAWLEQQWDKAVKDSETPDKELLEKYTFYDGLTTAYEFTIARLNPADRRTPRGSRYRGAACAGPCMHSGSRVCICMHPEMHTEKARKKPENPYI